MVDWTDLFENYGVKTASLTDKEKSAYVPTADQRAALAAAGIEPSFGEDKAVYTIEVLFDPSQHSMQVSYYNSERAGSGRSPEARIGQGMPRWINAGDQVVIGNIGGRVFVAKEPVPPLGEAFLTTENGALLTAEDGEPLTVSVESDLDVLMDELRAGRPALIGSLVEQRRRREILARIEELENELRQLAPEHGGMGHNNPPQDEKAEAQDAAVIATVAEATTALRIELAKEDPDVIEVAKSGSVLRNIGSWLAGKGDTFADEFAKNLGKSLGDAVGKAVGIAMLLTTISRLVGGWLQAITWPF